ncbi:MAG: hypothetical protein A4E20_04745 [Nitrospira sp. SG-bin2]|uniref:Lar family restriction alleviation protein n=1 Tax=Nitrospira cf. moscoviensis SBR1015 TaxID=96242 RepID=UPI000A0B04FD|nr:Lar family restriction alleviation protein [Nitrospira cf. moscoviensis SBR1015]OQW38085.1 MAG: hypothetical protein A4E20_04745 [Nitrospira sp. SG-bin2]
MEPKPCPFCGSEPVIHHKKNAQRIIGATTNAGEYFKVECVSDKCSMREVRTHACGSREAAIEVWNG